MHKNENYPLRKGFNDALGYYQSRNDAVSSSVTKKGAYKDVQPQAYASRTEVKLPTHIQGSLKFDMF